MDAQGEEKCKDHSMRNDKSREKNKHGPPLPFWKYDIMHAVPLVGMQLSQPTAKINALASGYCSRSKGRLYKDSQWLLFSYSCGAWYKFTSISIAHAPDEYSPLALIVKYCLLTRWQDQLHHPTFYCALTVRQGLGLEYRYFC